MPKSSSATRTPASRSCDELALDLAVVVEEDTLGDLHDQLVRIHPAGLRCEPAQLGEVARAAAARRRR